MSDNDIPTLFICTTCKRSGAAERADPPPGELLFKAAEELAQARGPAAPVRVAPIVCFGNCERGCTAGLSQDGKWSYLVGGLGPEHAADLLAYGEAYAKSEKGTVLRAGRPESLRHAIVARFPAPLTVKETAP